MSPDLQFRAHVVPHMDALYRFAYRLTGRVADAEDLVQDVLVKLYTRRDELGQVRDLATWMKRVLYNQFVDDKRRYRRQPMHLVDHRYDPDDAEDPHSGAAQIDADDTARALQGALGQLSEDHRVVVLLHDAEGYKLEEIQELTGISLGTIKSRLHRARARLRELLTGDGTFSTTPACRSIDGARNDVSH